MKPSRDKLAESGQTAKITQHGGKGAIWKRGHFRYSPTPGAKAADH